MLKRLQLVQRQLTTIQKARNSILIRGGTIVNADRQFRADVVIENGKIKHIHKPEDKVLSQMNFTKVYDATNKVLLPGGIDPHVHLELPFMGTTSIDDFDKGSRAAVAGGTTTYIDFIVPGPDGLIAAYDDWRRRAD
jgi:dihydropyrimidinase